MFDYQGSKVEMIEEPLNTEMGQQKLSSMNNREKRQKKSEPSLGIFWDKILKNLTWLLSWVPEAEEEEIETEKLSKEVMTRN